MSDTHYRHQSTNDAVKAKLSNRNTSQKDSRRVRLVVWLWSVCILAASGYQVARKTAALPGDVVSERS